jgi:hypothetical protein
MLSHIPAGHLIIPPPSTSFLPTHYNTLPRTLTSLSFHLNFCTLAWPLFPRDAAVDSRSTPFRYTTATFQVLIRRSGCQLAGPDGLEPYQWKRISILRDREICWKRIVSTKSDLEGRPTWPHSGIVVPDAPYCESPSLLTTGYRNALILINILVGSTMNPNQARRMQLRSQHFPLW